MEEARGGRSFPDGIQPPRIEDAGLEDCALPPESIREAFLKAASAVGSLNDGDDPGSEDRSDSAVATTAAAHSGDRATESERKSDASAGLKIGEDQGKKKP